MIFLLGMSDFDEGKHENSGAEEHSWRWGDTSHIWEYFWVFAFDLLEVDAQGIEAVIYIIVVGISSYLIWKTWLEKFLIEIWKIWNIINIKKKGISASHTKKMCDDMALNLVSNTYWLRKEHQWCRGERCKRFGGSF